MQKLGLFANETGNNCLFRIVFDPIRKTETTVVEVTWTITIISIDSQNNPYDEVDKSGLYQAMDALLHEYGVLHSELKESADYLKTIAINTYASSSVSQSAVNDVTDNLSKMLAKLTQKGE